MNETLTPPTTFVPPGHPVRRFVLALAVIGAAAVGLWWSALAAPRISTQGASWQYDSTAGTGTVQFELQNDGPFALQVRSIDLADTQIAITATVAGGVDLATAAANVDRGEVVPVVVAFSAPCSAGPFGRIDLDYTLRVTVSTAAGIRRTRTVSGGSFSGSCQ